MAIRLICSSDEFSLKIKKRKRRYLLKYFYRSEELMAEDNYVNIKQNSSDRDRVFEEFNKLFENFMAKNSTVKDLECFEILETEKIALDNRVTTVSQLKGPEKEEFIEKALDFACNIQYGDLRAQTLSLLVSILEGAKKGRTYRKSPLFFLQYSR